MSKVAKNTKPKKQRPKKYEEKLAVSGTFADVFKVVKKNKEEKKLTNSDGSPKDGKEAEFFESEKAKAKRKLEQLPEDVRQNVLESERALNKRMNS